MIRNVWCLAIGLLLSCGVTTLNPKDDENVGQQSSELRICPNGPTVSGIDVSQFNGTVNWTAVKQSGRAFGIARIGDSLSVVDPTFPANWRNIKAAGMVRGAYQFFRPSQSATEQAQRMIDAVGRLGPDDLPAILDAEERSGRTDAEIVAAMRTWLRLVEQGTGKRPIIYTAEFFWGSLSGTAEFASYPLWVANYRATCPFVPATWNKWVMWQTAEDGVVAGVPGDTDLNVFNGTLADLKAFAAGGVVGGGGGGEVLEVAVSRETDGTQVFSAWGSDKVTSVRFAVDGFALSAAAKDASGAFVLRTKLTANVVSRTFEATGLDAQGASVGRGIALFDAVDGAGVFIRQVAAQTYEIGLERAPSAVASIEVRADGFLLTDSVTGTSRSARRAVRSSFTLLGSRTFTVSTFNADGTSRGTLTRSFSLE